MRCCKAKKYGWCKDEKSAYTDSEGSHYCIFHAPKEIKDKFSSNDFNDLVFNKIQEHEEPESACDLSGTVFIWNINFSRFTRKKLPKINFSESKFCGKADFSWLLFSEDVDFRKVIFDHDASFLGVNFGGKADFSWATFNGKAYFYESSFKKESHFFKTEFTKETDFSKSVFEDEIIFLNAKFEEKADFLQTEFSGKTSFHESIFNGKTNFILASFKKYADFMLASFKDEINFLQTDFSVVDFSWSTFHEKTNFSGVTFGGETNVRWVDFEKGVSFSKAIFGSIVSFKGTHFSRESGDAIFADVKFKEMSNKEAFTWVTFHRVANFSNAKFGGEISFSYSTFGGKTYFLGDTFMDDGRLSNLSIKDIVRLENVNLKKVSFLDTDVRKMDFINCTWHRKGLRNILYDEKKLYQNETSQKKEIDDKTISLLGRLKKKYKDYRERIEKVEILYRYLKQKCKEEHNEPGVSVWNYGEKEMYRKGNIYRRYFPLSFSSLYWITSGYGERAIRAGVVLMLLIVTLSFLFSITGIKPFEQTNKKADQVIKLHEAADILNLDNLSNFILCTLQYATFDRHPSFIPATSLGGYVKLAAKIFIPIQATLFALAIRNRLRR